MLPGDPVGLIIGTRRLCVEVFKKVPFIFVPLVWRLGPILCSTHLLRQGQTYDLHRGREKETRRESGSNTHNSLHHNAKCFMMWRKTNLRAHILAQCDHPLHESATQSRLAALARDCSICSEDVRRILHSKSFN